MPKRDFVDRRIMPKLVQACETVEEFETLRTQGPNAGVAKGLVSMTNVARETKRKEKWARMMNQWYRFTHSKSMKLKQRVRKGIPDENRRTAWNRLVEVNVYISKYPELYEILSSSTVHIDLSEKIVQSYRNIELDLYRTFPEMQAFIKNTSQGEETVASLRRVLRAYAVFDEEVGYCQSMNFIAGTLLLYLPEREAFWHLVVIMQRQTSALRGMYRPGMEQTILLLETLDGLIRLHLPKLAAHWQEEGISATMFATEWYMSLFTRTFPVALTARVLECFLSEGLKVVHRVALALLLDSQDRLLQSDMGATMILIRNLPKTIDADVIMETAFNIKLKQQQIDDTRGSMNPL